MKTLLSLFTLLFCFTMAKAQQNPESFYSIEAKTIDGKTVKMEDYKDKIILIVNTASKCGFTPQYEGLQTLHEKYGSKGLVILGFPCNQFAGQEPEGNDKIATFCSVNYSVEFQMFEKISVNGDDTHPLYKYLKKHAPGVLGTELIKWNFTKFLVTKEGEVYNRYASSTAPESMVDDIETLLAK